MEVAKDLEPNAGLGVSLLGAELKGWKDRVTRFTLHLPGSVEAWCAKPLRLSTLLFSIRGYGLR